MLAIWGQHDSKSKLLTLAALIAAACLIAILAGCTSTSSGAKPSASATSTVASSSSKSSAVVADKDCPYAGDWNILLAIDSIKSATIKPVRASGMAHVSNSEMSIRCESEGASSEYEGKFDQVTDEGHWMYKVDDSHSIGIGENKSAGAIIGVVVELGQSSSGDDGSAYVLERADLTVNGSEPFVGRWQCDYGITVDITPAGTLIGEDADGIWYNFFTVKGDTLQLTGIPDKFVLDGDQLHYIFENYDIVFYRA